MVLADNLVILWTALIHILTNCGVLSAFHENCDFHFSCCCKTAVCIWDQLLDFSLPELVQRLALTRKSFRIAQVSLCAVQPVYIPRMFSRNGFDTMHVECTELLCVVCIGLFIC